MQGYNTLWLPGTDHAGIATQNVIERQLSAEGTDRHQLGREAFIRRVWQWKETSGGIIINQLKRLGCSCDWSRERFTMDAGLCNAVCHVFIQLYNEGLIYRDEKINNWCPRCHTALSDLEVEYENQPAHLYYVRYPSAEGNGGITVATTRPETIPGDTAVAVHPEDERHASLVGSRVRLPVEPFRRVPIVTDVDVDPSFGTGALKITPAHDSADFEIGRRNKLEAVKVIDELGRMTGTVGRYAGLDRFTARQEVVGDLKEQGLLERVEDYTVPLGRCYRCKTVVEPALSPQWFVKVGPLAVPAIRSIREKRTRIIPAHWEKTYFDWMENIRDWCISRQIWWGHQIPAWYCLACNEGRVTRSSLPSSTSTGRIQEESWRIDVNATPIISREKPESCPGCGGNELIQDPDVLDTWFSSALWPFSTLGWPKKTPLLEVFYPTSALVTGFDILFFWVARMMMMGLRFMGNVPFREVYIHAMVRDAEGHKMSKSRGNVIDPLGMMERYGTDAVRFTLAAMAVQGRDIKLSEERIAGYRNFVTKIWNANRLLAMHLGPDFKPETVLTPVPVLEDRWILSRLNDVVRRVNTALEGFRFNEAASAMYQFAWHEFCDWYLEIIKPRLSSRGRNGGDARQVGLFVFRRFLALLHPLMPFVTEEISHGLPGSTDLLLAGPYPQPEDRWSDPGAEEQMALIVEFVNAVRTIRGEMNLEPGLEVEVKLRKASPTVIAILAEMGPTVKRLSRARSLDFGRESIPDKSATAPVSFGEIFVPLEGVVDFLVELRRLEKELARIEADVSRLRDKLGREEFLTRAPEEIVSKNRQRLAELLEKKKLLQGSREQVLSWMKR
jgi:valyl-tRNA synthetase